MHEQLLASEVLGSILDRDTDCSDWGFPWYSGVPPCKYRDSALK
jgi:hypothetical protein